MDKNLNVDALYATFSSEYMRLSSLDVKKEDGASFNCDGSQYDGMGLALAVTSRNVELPKVSVEDAWSYVEGYLSALSSEDLKLGLFKFEGSMAASMDITAILPNACEAAVLEFARFAGQHSVWDCELEKLILSGSDGADPLQFSPAEVVDIYRSLSVGSLPKFLSVTAG